MSNNKPTVYPWASKISSIFKLPYGYGVTDKAFPDGTPNYTYAQMYIRNDYVFHCTDLFDCINNGMIVAGNDPSRTFVAISYSPFKERFMLKVYYGPGAWTHYHETYNGRAHKVLYPASSDPESIIKNSVNIQPGIQNPDIVTFLINVDEKKKGTPMGASALYDFLNSVNADFGLPPKELPAAFHDDLHRLHLSKASILDTETNLHRKVQSIKTLQDNNNNNNSITKKPPPQEDWRGIFQTFLIVATLIFFHNK